VLKFLIILALTALLILTLGLWRMDPLPAFFYQTLTFLFLATAGLYRFLLKTKNERPDFFVILYLATLVMKLLAYGVYLFIIIRSMPGEAARDVVFFMGVYSIFTTLEIAFLYRKVNT
jgi:hypothetical protein